MLARRALQATRPQAFASSSSSSSPLLSCTATASFSTSTTLQESKARRKSRLTKKAHMDKKATLVRQHDLAEPHPVLGYSDVTSSALWDKCLLKSVLLDRHQVWGSAVKVVAGESAARTAVVDAEEGGEVNGPAATEGDSKYTPELFNFGLSPPLASTLSSTLPTVASLLPLLGTKLSSTAVVQSRATRAGELEAYKREQLMRIVDLRNASSKGIEVENTRRIVEAFGRAEGDTGSPEVQAAILTSRIHSLTSHLRSQPRDVHNRRPLRSLIHQRAKVLKYLRSVDVLRYEQCLEKIGVEARAVEGEVVVRKEVVRELIRGV